MAFTFILILLVALLILKKPFVVRMATLKAK